MVHGDPTQNATALGPKVGLSVSRLARLFKKDMGVSLVAYRNDLRMERFFRLLDDHEWQWTTLAAAVRAAGFGSYAQFHRLFRSRVSLAPREFLVRRRAATTDAGRT